MEKNRRGNPAGFYTRCQKFFLSPSHPNPFPRLGGEGIKEETFGKCYNRSIRIDFQGAKITADVGFLMMREVDERFRIIDSMKDCLKDLSALTHTEHSLVQMVRGGHGCRIISA